MLESFIAFCSTLIGVVFLDIILSGDNAVIIAMAANGLKTQTQKDTAIKFGIATAIILRIICALVAVWLIQYKFLGLLGGVLLLSVAYSIYKDIRAEEGSDAKTNKEHSSFIKAIGAIAIADLSMSLDNILAVVGMAQDHPAVMAFGIIFSMIALMYLSQWISRLLDKHLWLKWAGFVLIVLVALKMIISNGYALVTVT